jgi:hypothetical protein
MILTNVDLTTAELALLVVLLVEDAREWESLNKGHGHQDHLCVERAAERRALVTKLTRGKRHKV